MLKILKQKSNNIAIFDDVAKKYVPLRGQNLKVAAHNIRDEYFWNLDRKELIEAVKICFRETE
jgi:hypothetical protein